MKPFKEDTVIKSIRFEKDLHDKILKIAEENDRDFSSQVRFICKRYFEMTEKK